MKYLIKYKLFESKLGDLIQAMSDDEDINDLLINELPYLFLKQFLSWLKTKLPKTFYEKDVYADTIDVDDAFASFSIQIESSQLIIEIDARNTDCFDLTISIGETVFKLEPFDIIKNISVKQQFFFEESFLEMLWQKILFVAVDHVNAEIYDITSTQSSPFEIRTLNDYFVFLQKVYPELLDKIVIGLEKPHKEKGFEGTYEGGLSASQLNNIRANFPTLYAAMKKQKGADQWGTDLQADAGEYGL